MDANTKARLSMLVGCIHDLVEDSGNKELMEKYMEVEKQIEKELDPNKTEQAIDKLLEERLYPTSTQLPIEIKDNDWERETLKRIEHEKK